MVNSYYELHQPLSSERLTHFWDYFSGSDLKSWWDTFGNAGGSVTMNDAVDGGIKIITGTTINNFEEMDFKDIRHYEPSGSVFIGEFNKVGTTGQTIIGLGNNPGASHIISLEARQTTANMRFWTHGGTFTFVDTGLATDSNTHRTKLEAAASSGLCSIDGDLVAVSTTNLPTLKMQPSCFVKTHGAYSVQSNVRYMEAYNT